MIQFNPYINFDNQAQSAMEFYQTVFGGKLTMVTFGEGGAPHVPDEAGNIMHSTLEADNGIILMAADTPSGMRYQPGTNMSLSLSGDTEEQLKKYWEKLSAGATVRQPLVKAPWGDTFGMLTDKFGIHWVVNVADKKE